MGKSKLKGKDLKRINYNSDKAKSLAINIMNRHFKHLSKPAKLEILQSVLADPDSFLEHELLGVLAREFAEVYETPSGRSYKLKEEAEGYSVYGRKFIDAMAIRQMDLAMKLPVAVSGALMPDAHVGYGLPVGGVLGTENAVIPYGVGLDIGCRMALTIYEAPADYIQRYSHLYKTALRDQTHFGIGKRAETSIDHEVLQSEAFQSTELLRSLHHKAVGQLGTSGSGNHFVEIGEVILDHDNDFGLDEGRYVGLLTHSGSRGLGATIANYYTRIALDKCLLPQGAKHLAWLDLDSEEGQEYWIAMNLAGDYAKACHDVIHHKISKAIGLKPAAKVENHHNFAWLETQDDGRDLIVHRKGATPAGEGQLGIIPATMTAPGFIVSGMGEADSLRSASHGAGRKLSRKKARASITQSEMKKILKNEGITLIGGGTDEAPMAYKDIENVMKSQTNLVEVKGKFQPRLVRMDKN